jgi:anaerobic selenocysteine-containing dehydrogenase
MTAFPQPERLQRALRRLKVLAVWDIVGSATAAEATHLFPCPDPLERADLVVPVHLSQVFAQYTPAVLPPRSGRRPMWWSLAKLAERMGLSILPGGVEADSCSDDLLFSSFVSGSPVSWSELLAAEGGPVEYTRHDRWVERTVLPDGRWDLAPPLLVDRLDHAITQGTHPVVLGNRRQVQHTNSTLAWESADPFVYVSPADAAASGVRDGDVVEVTSAHGRVSGTACLDDGMAAGTVVIPHGFSEPNVAHLTATDVEVDPLTGMPTLVGVPVSVRPRA